MEEVIFTLLLEPALSIWSLTVPWQNLSSNVVSGVPAYSTTVLYSHRNINHTCEHHLDHCTVRKAVAAQTACKICKMTLDSKCQELSKYNPWIFANHWFTSQAPQWLTEKSKFFTTRRCLHPQRKKKRGDHTSNTLKGSKLAQFPRAK